MEPQEPIEPQRNQEEAPAPPQPIQARGGWPILRTTLGLLVATGGAIFMLVSASTGATRGGTRSCKVKWQQREQEVIEAIAIENSPQAIVDQQQSQSAGHNPSNH